jgi:hypothetical protein
MASSAAASTGVQTRPVVVAFLKIHHRKQKIHTRAFLA